LAADILFLVFGGLAQFFDQCFLACQLTFHGGQPVIENDNIGATGTTPYSDDTEKKIGKIIVFHNGFSIVKIWLVIKQ